MSVYVVQWRIGSEYGDETSSTHTQHHQDWLSVRLPQR